MTNIQDLSRPHQANTSIAFIGALVRHIQPTAARCAWQHAANQDGTVRVAPGPAAVATGRQSPAERQALVDLSAAVRVRHGGDAIHLSPGVVIPGTRYRLLRWIGDGGMGVVYEAEHIDINHRVAIKVLRPEMCEQPQALQLFRDEARAAGKIGSAYIVEILDFAELSDGRLLYAMELLGGRALSRAIAEHALPASRVIGILRQLCKGLASAHAAHIVHRDIKPDNIFLDERQSRRDVVKILDFGISVFMVDATHTDTSIVGTPLYLAPEIIASKPFDARVDMYAVGCTAHEMLTGRPPYTGTVKELLHAHVHAPLPLIADLVRDHDVPAALAAVIVRCLAKRPEDRFADMTDLEAALCEAQIVAGLETGWDDLALPDVDGERRDLLLHGMPEPVAILPRRRRRFHVVAAVLGAVLLGGAAFLGGTLTTDAATATDPELARLEAAARAAAARVAFVYPPVDEPQATTAYQVIRELEELRGPHGRAARELARTLRLEFGGTLGAFGDRLWDRPGGLEFAVDVYAQALLFDPDREPAALRAGLTPGQLARLAVKAASCDFSETELIAVEPLVVLADVDVADVTPALVAARESIARRTRSRDAALVRPVRTATPAVGGLASVGARSAGAASDPGDRPLSPVGTRPRAPAPGRGRAEPSVDPPRDEARRDPAAAAMLLGQARAAVRAGRVDDAERLYELALVSDNRSVGAHVGLTELYFNRGEYARAQSFGEDALRLAPDNAVLHLLVGDAAFKVFRFDDARQQYLSAEKLGHAEAELRLDKLAARYTL